MPPLVSGGGCGRWATASPPDVEQTTQTGQSLVIDVREARRFRGEVEPIALLAVNVPFTNNLNATGNFLPPHDLRDKYLLLLSQQNPAEVIVHCDSGVTAYTGLAVPKLYVGSWSEWSRSGRPVATGE